MRFNDCKTGIGCVRDSSTWPGQPHHTWALLATRRRQLPRLSTACEFGNDDGAAWEEAGAAAPSGSLAEARAPTTSWMERAGWTAAA
jgi:hypothetical protein